MKLFFTLSIFFICVIANAQNKIVDSLPPFQCWFASGCQTAIEKPVTIKDAQVRIRSVVTNSSEPLLVIDGVAHEFKELQSLNPDDIASIDILKYEKLGVFSCNSAHRDLIVVTTKSAYAREFIVKDFLTGDNIPKATICFMSGNDSNKTVANDSGILITDKLMAGVKYNITVSSAGYKTFSTAVNGKQQEIFLERDIKECANVIVSRSSCPKKITCWGYANRKIMKEKNPAVEDKVMIKSVYPNPVQRDAVFNLEFENKQDETMQLAITSMNGSMVLLQSKKITRGLNHLSIIADAKWAAGIYNIQLRNEKGTLIRQEKLIVQ